jgi:hypothetical protein
MGSKKCWWGHLLKSVNLQDREADGSITSRWTLERKRERGVLRMRGGSNWLKFESSGELLY